MQSADNDNSHATPDIPTEAAGKKPLSPAAQRALQEAEERRAAAEAVRLPEEFGGRGGADPARFGDWEIDGRAVDF